MFAIDNQADYDFRRLLLTVKFCIVKRGSKNEVFAKSEKPINMQLKTRISSSETFMPTSLAKSLLATSQKSPVKTPNCTLATVIDYYSGEIAGLDMANN